MRIFGTLTLLFLATTGRAEMITSQEWTSFTTPTGQNAPTSFDNPNGSPYLQASNNAIITSGGFLYSFSGPLTLSVFAPNYDLGPGYATSLTLTVGLSPAGLPLDPSSVVVTPSGGSAIAASSFNETDSVWTFQWDLPTNAASYLFSLTGGPHMAVDTVAVSTAARAVPEPAAVASLLVGLAGVGAIAARRRKPRALVA